MSRFLPSSGVVNNEVYLESWVWNLRPHVHLASTWCIHVISFPRPSSRLPLICFCVLYWVQTKEQKRGRPGNEAKIAVFVHTSSVLSLEHSAGKEFLILSWYQRTIFLSIYAGANCEAAGGKCTFHAERWNSDYIFIYCWMNSGNKILAIFMCCIHALMLHPQDVK